MILPFGTDKSGQTEQIKIRLLLDEQFIWVFNVSIPFAPFRQKYAKVWPLCLNLGTYN